MIIQFVRFSMVGISSSLVNFAFYNLSRIVLSRTGLFHAYEYIPALVVGFSISVLWAYVFSRKYVFLSEKEKAVPWYRALPRMYLAYSFTGVVLNVLLSMLWVELLRVPEGIISLVNDAISAPVNFLLIKYWSFGRD